MTRPIEAKSLSGGHAIPLIAANVCADLFRGLAKAAALSVLAHIKNLVERRSLETNLL